MANCIHHPRRQERGVIERDDGARVPLCAPCIAVALRAIVNQEDADDETSPQLALPSYTGDAR